MELPRKILIGEGVISELGSLIHGLGAESARAAIISGKNVKERAGTECESSLEKESIEFSWHVVGNSSMDTVAMLEKELGGGGVRPDYVVGFGGGRSVDV